MSRRKSITHQEKKEAFICDDGKASSSSGMSDREAGAGGGDGFRGASPNDSGTEDPLNPAAPESKLFAKVLFGALISILLGACVTVAYHLF
ncbi:hypothetical protein HPB48_022711 [Haemaphysalis longicornis]|uniref:Uncharacterized protein n=1 Tax=Haemaphysalis longicornis TaxID=44386 RepID=A0A9J6FPN8_HAELO|nr:hypothetical protein HPB48_022711 [Haemaphysalis longicornis]